MGKWIIQDWSGQELDVNGRFAFKGKGRAPLMTFDTFENGWEWIRTNMKEEDWEEVSVERKEA